MAAWFPRGALWAVAFWFAALLAEGTVHRVLLYLLRPSHELEEIPTVFTVLVPMATFFVYLTQLLSFFLLFYFSVFILRAPTRARFHRWMLSLVLFFAFPALALNGLLIPTHMAGHLLWYYIGTICVLIVIFLFLWHASLRFPTRRSRAFLLLLCGPSILLILARLLNPQASGTPGSGSWAGTLFHLGNQLFLFQGLAWPFLIPTGRARPSAPLFPVKPLLASLLLALGVALFFRLAPSSATSLWFAGWRVTLPLENLPLLLYFLSLWASFFAITRLVSSRRRWRIFLGILLMCWLVTGFSPYQEMEVLPYLAMISLLAIGTAFSSVDEPPMEHARFAPAPWAEALGAALEPISTDRRRLTRYAGQSGQTPIRLDVFTLDDGRLGGLRLCLGEEPAAEPDWVCCPISQVPLARHFFPTLPRVSPMDESSCTQVAIWDRNFFSEDLLDEDLLRSARRLLLGELSVWWGQCLTYEASYLPTSPQDVQEFCRLVALVARRAGALEEPD